MGKQRRGSPWRWLALLVGIAVFSIIAFGWTKLVRLTGNAHRNDVSVFYTPYGSPGDTVHLGVGVYGGLKAGLGHISVRTDGTRADAEGRGSYWGYSIRTKSTTSGTDDIDMALTIPVTATAGQPLALSFDIGYVMAKASIGGFDNHRGRERLTLELPVCSTPIALVRRTLALLQATIFWLILALLLLRAPAMLKRIDEGSDSETSEDLGYALIAGALVLAMAGYTLFAQPLMAAFGISHDAFVVVAMLAWIAGPIATAWWLHKRRPQPNFYRIEPVTKSPSTYAALVGALRHAGLTTDEVQGRERLRAIALLVSFARRSPDLIIRDNEGNRGDVLLDTPDEHGWPRLRIRGESAQIALRAAHGIATLVGPVDFVGPGYPLRVGPGDDLQSLEKKYNEALVGAAKAMMERLDEVDQMLKSMLQR